MPAENFKYGNIETSSSDIAIQGFDAVLYSIYYEERYM